MILGIGVDIVECRRFEPWMEKPAMIARFFSSEEAALAGKRGKRGGAATLAVRFAAREALGKALGTGLRGLILKELPVFSPPGTQGRPLFQPSPEMAQYLARRGVGRIHLSLSHERDSAVAMVCLEARTGSDKSD